MGVKDLWNILSPLCERKPMFELQGKTVAIDLSCWVVDSQTIVDNSVQPKMYLRNLYFRTAFLLMQGISPVFVLEGTAPSLKHNTIAKRNNIRSGFRERKTTRKPGRSQFNRILNECRDMLTFMGLICVQGCGEAEAMCAYLNQDGLVDGCISQDSDCFLYGAKVVYRNFCTSAQGNRGGTGGAVDEYSMNKIERILNLGRNKMIALALLCGCDYDEGLSGVGKEAAMKLFKIVKDEDVLERIKAWRTDHSLDKKEAELQYSNLCTSCGHPGKLQKHTKSGCAGCGTVVKCNDSYREERALILNEISLRKKALLSENFPNQELIDEFLIRKDSVPARLDLQWKQPEVYKFVNFMEKHLTWEPQYSFEKLFPLITRWQLQQLPNLSIESRLLIPHLFIPETIKKIRNIRCVASYEVIWRNDHDVVDKLREYEARKKENDDSDDADAPFELTSIEPQDSVLKCYPELVEAFENLRNAKTKKRGAKSRKQDNAGDDAENVEKDGGKKRAPKKKGGKKIAENKNKKIDDFITPHRPPMSLEESLEKLSITPKRSKMDNAIKTPNPFGINKQLENPNRKSFQRKLGPQFDKVLQVEKVSSKLNNTLDRMFNELSPDDFISDNDDHDLNMSEIIEGICGGKSYKFNFDNPETISEIENESVRKSFETGEIGADNSSSINDQKSELSVDEFDINESYVPLSQRLMLVNQKRSISRKSRESKEKRSGGFENLMNETDP